ncbi:MAG: nuclear transport factor 2 family protein [Chlamydiia bacterium]|nr:nuclear transport factor 2 family protein [Chlamydiia bacterium]
MKNTLSTAVAYYTALGKKNLEEIEKYLHPDIQFTDPQETVIGKEAVLKAAQGFSGIFKTLTIHAKFSSEEQAMIVYDVEIPGFAKNLRAASLLSFKEGLISKIELIYDSRCFLEGQ